jgi:HEAT repeat protein
MKKWGPIGLGVILLGAAAALLEPTGVVLGWIGGEPFFQDRPARYWQKALAAEDPKTHAAASQALKDGGTAALPVLVALVRQPAAPAEVRSQAADLIGQLGDAGQPALPTLVTVAREADPHLRPVVVGAVAKIGFPGADAVPFLVGLLKSPDRLPALRALARGGADATVAVADVVPLLKDGDVEVRWNAARTLGKIGPAAAAAVPDLVAALKDDAAPVREHAAESLGQIGSGPPAVVEALAAALKDPDARVRRDAVRSLGQVGAAAKPAIAAITALKEDSEQRVRDAAEKALQAIQAAP